MWDDEKIYNTARDVASRELRFIAIKETLIQMRNEDERELVECAKSNLEMMARCGDLSRELEKAQRRIAELETQLFEIGIVALDVAFLRKTVAHLESQHDVGMRLAEAKDNRIAELEEHLQFAVRLACSSTNHDKRACHGHLWVCSGCNNIICCAEGTDDHPDVCDSCWNKSHTEQATSTEDTNDETTHQSTADKAEEILNPKK